MKNIIKYSAFVLVLFFGVVTVAHAYSWYNFNGHSYSLTDDWNNWLDAEAEAVSLGGHLVTINNDAENIWLTNTFQDAYVRSYPGSSWQNIAWIGYYSTDGGSSWEWIGGDTVTYFRHDYPSWPQGGIHAYLHLANHPYPGTWNANLPHDTNYNYNPKGIIEVVPVPAAVWLLGSGLIGLLGIRRKFKK